MPGRHGRDQMPTPSSADNIAAASSIHSSCPPDDDRSSWRGLQLDDSQDEAIVTAPETFQQPTPPPSDSQLTGSTETHAVEQPQSKRMDIEEETNGPDMLSPMSAETDKQDDSEMPTLSRTDLSSPSMGYDFSNIRVCTHQKQEVLCLNGAGNAN